MSQKGAFFSLLFPFYEHVFLLLNCSILLCAAAAKQICKDFRKFWPPEQSGLSNHCSKSYIEFIYCHSTQRWNEICFPGPGSAQKKTPFHSSLIHGGTLLEMVSSLRYLAVHISNDLIWSFNNIVWLMWSIRHFLHQIFI